MSSYHKTMSEAGEQGMPLFPAHGCKLVRSPEKALHAKAIKPVPFTTPPKTAIVLTGWAGSTPKTEKLHAWPVKNGVMFATPHNGKAGLIVKDGFAFIPAEKRVALGIETRKAKRSQGKAKAKAKGKAKGKTVKARRVVRKG